MTEIFHGLTHAIIAALLGIGAAVGAVALVTDHRDAEVTAFAAKPAVPVSDRVRETVAALREDGVYVAPDGRYLLDERGERTVERAVAASTTPVYVIVWAENPDLGSSPIYLEDQLKALGPERGVIFRWSGPQTGEVVVIDEAGGSVPEFSSAQDFVGDPAVTLPVAVAAVADTYWYGGDSGSDDSDEWGGVGGGIAAGGLFAGGIILVLLSAGWVGSRTMGKKRLLPGHWTWREDGP